MTWETFFQVVILVILVSGAILIIMAGMQTVADAKSKRRIEQLRTEHELRQMWGDDGGKGGREG